MEVVIPLEEAFDPLKAEHEGEWLERVWVYPQEFARMVGMQSILVYATEGSGKSTLHRLLLREGQKKKIVVVSWQPMPLSSSEETPMQAFRKQVFDVLALSLLQQIGENPAPFFQSSRWVQESIASFIRSHLLGDLSLRMERLFTTSQLDTEAVQRVLTFPLAASMEVQTPSATLLSELLGTLSQIGYQGIWVLIEAWGAWEEMEEESPRAQLSQLLSSLAWFEQSGLALKIIAPLSLRPVLNTTNAVARRRIEVVYLKWSPELLQQALERRLQYTFGKPDFSLAQLVESASTFKRWLTRHGGETPRGWLAMAYPFVRAWREKGTPLTDKEWEALYRQSPPLLYLDPRSGQVIVGYGQIELSPTSYRLLRYLYEHRHRPCSKEELFYLAHQELEAIPRKEDERWEPPTLWEGTLDTALWRLRRELEWEPKSPLYLQVVKKKSLVQLRHTW